MENQTELVHVNFYADTFRSGFIEISKSTASALRGAHDVGSDGPSRGQFYWDAVKRVDAELSSMLGIRYEPKYPSAVRYESVGAHKSGARLIDIKKARRLKVKCMCSKKFSS